MKQGMEGNLNITGWCSVKDETLFLNGKKERIEENFANFAAFIKALFKKHQISYPKFYKMDNLSKLGFLTAEMLLSESDVLKRYDSGEIGVVIANSNSSLDTDLDHQETIRDRSNFFPSPAVFVYTLPNIMTGEICIRHKIRGENTFLVSETFDAERMAEYVGMQFEQAGVGACICGWVDVMKEQYHSLLCIVEREGNLAFGKENLYRLFNFSE